MRYERKAQGANDSKSLLTYAVVTTETSPGIRGLHEGMPVILSGEDKEVRFDPDTKDTERFLRLLRPYPDEKISAYRSWRGGITPANDKPELAGAV